jgi:ketosteroid isomerase-like protein
LTWSPDFIDVSASGDMAYTYGKYNYTTTDSLGNVSEIEGIFHTVWKRQADGNWKFV